MPPRGSVPHLWENPARVGVQVLVVVPESSPAAWEIPLALFSSSSEESRTEFLLRIEDLKDALEAAEVPHRRRKTLGFGVLLIGVIALILGLTVDTGLLSYAILAFLIPFFGLGFFLMAGQEVRRLRREVDALEGEWRSLETGEIREDNPDAVRVLENPEGDGRASGEGKGEV